MSRWLWRTALAVVGGLGFSPAGLWAQAVVQQLPNGAGGRGAWVAGAAGAAVAGRVGGRARGGSGGWVLRLCPALTGRRRRGKVHSGADGEHPAGPFLFKTSPVPES